MNKAAIVFLSAAISAAALACPQDAPVRVKPAGDTKPPVTVTIEAKASIGSLDTSDRNEVQKYECDLKNAGLTQAEVTLLVDDEVQIRFTAKKTLLVASRQQTTPAPSGSASSGSHPGMGPHVRALLAQGLRGKELAAAIHAEKARRHGAKGHGKGAGGHGRDDAGHGKDHGAPGDKSSDHGKGSSPAPDRKPSPTSGKGDADRPTAPPADEPAPRARGGQSGKPDGGQGPGGGSPAKRGGKQSRNPKDDNDDG